MASTDLIHIGFGNYVASNHMVGIASPGSAPVKRLVQEGRGKSNTIDMTSGRRTKAVVFMDNGTIVLAAITPETIEGRARGRRLQRVHGDEDVA
ncbi:MAG: extracellular matrix/biofilm biosynthesis regulator RemA family protein [Dehalococcoidia bacterium]